MFWNICRVYFSLIYKILKAIVGLFFSNVFQSSIFDGYFIPFPLWLFIKGLIFDILCRFLLISSWFNTTVAAYWKHLSSSFFGFIVAFFFFIQSGESIYDSPHLTFILWHLQYNSWTESKINHSPSLIFLNQFGILKEVIHKVH